MTGMANPFTRRTVLALVGGGAILFIALLWMVGAGLAGGSLNDGGGHAGGRGLNGYAALGDYLERRGYAVRRAQSPGALDDPGLVVLTPPHGADGKELERIVSARRHIGPTLVVTPKWIAGALPAQAPGGKAGWVELVSAQPPDWPGFLDDVSVAITPMGEGGKAARWQAIGNSGELPVSEQVLSGTGTRLVPLVVGEADQRILAAYLDDGGYYERLDALAFREPSTDIEDEELYPLVIIFEPDLFDNYGMAEKENAGFADRLFSALADHGERTVIFDLTLNGLVRSANLLTLAFTLPFLAATLCLLAAGLVVGWRAFLRFGPARTPERPIAFGKGALVANAAGLMRRSGRMHLIANPYAEATRERLMRLLCLPRPADPASAEAAIDRALHARLGEGARFSALAARLRQATKPHEILHAARSLHALKRKLMP